MKKPYLKAWAFALLASVAGLTQSCRDDSLYEEPSWLGNSIYERLQEEGNYTYTLRLIDSLGLTDVFRQTGSKTLFVTDDETYDAYFASKGIKSFDELSEAQIKMLLNSAMINNAYLIDLLSNVSGNPPESGQCMRRPTAVSAYDTVSRILPSEMPNTSYWEKYKGKKDGIVLLRDNTPQPMIHFLPSYMRKHGITNADLQKLTNGQCNNVSDSYVNGMKVIERDITCKNGYIHKVDGVMMSADNMANIINNHPLMSTYASLLNRFSAPYYDASATATYNRLYNNTDSVYVLRYFAETSAVGSLSTDPDGQTVDAQLMYDPGWNEYIYSNTAGYDLHYDAGAMLVPTNKALENWWNGAGKVIQDMYGSWENVPMKVLVKLLNLNMINAFSETFPSKFNNIVDNATKVPIGIKPADVDSCFMGCNGVVYLTNVVFTPAEYSSVSFPALINQNTMSVIYWGLEQLNFEAYLNSMDSYYSFIIPTNNAMLEYIDPCSYATYPLTILYRFYYDTQAKTVKANRFRYNVETKSIVEGEELVDANNAEILDRLEDIIDNMIVVGDVEDGHTYYKTKGGSTIKVANAGIEGEMTIEGGWQIFEGSNNPVVTQIYDLSEKGNGKSYVMNAEMPMSSKRSTYSILRDNPEFSAFFALLGGSSLMSEKMSGRYTCVDKNINLFDAYNYTVYVPTNEAIQQLHDEGLLPTWSDYESLTVEDFGGDATALKNAQSKVAGRITDFLRYHIQDNALFIGADSINGGKYETSKMNGATKRFYSIEVTADDNAMVMKDQVNDATRRVITEGGLYNIMGREYWIETTGSGANERTQIYNASDVVVHQSDGVLLYEKSQLKPWREDITWTTTE